MILLRILSKDEKIIEESALLLLKENLAIDINIKRHLERLELKDEKLSPVRIYMITAKTKSLLFPQIDKRLNEKFLKEVPEIYSLPIVQMDWKQAEHLTENVLKA